MNIRHIPPAPLNTYIKCLYYCDQPMPYQREKILPLPELDIKVNFGGRCQVYQGDQTEPFVTCVDSWWVGLWNAYHVIEWPADINFFMVEFQPGGAYPFLGIPLSEFHNQVVSLDNIWGAFAAEIRERLESVPTIAARFALLENLLLVRLRNASPGLDIVQHAMTEIAKQHGALSIRVLSDQMGISQKHLISQFKRLIGGTPKELARMYRFQHVLYSIDLTQPVEWTQVAYQSGYYDQSHFNKDFEAFTGHTPTDYLHLRRGLHAEHPHHAQYLRCLPTG